MLRRCSETVRPRSMAMEGAGDATSVVHAGVVDSNDVVSGTVSAEAQVDDAPGGRAGVALTCEHVGLVE